MTRSKLVSVFGAVSAAILAALAVEGFVPLVYAPWLLLFSTALAAAGRRLVETERFNNVYLTWALVAVSVLTVVAGAAQVVGARVAVIAGGVSVVLLSLSRSLFGWGEGQPPVS